MAKEYYNDPNTDLAKRAESQKQSMCDGHLAVQFLTNIYQVI